MLKRADEAKPTLTLPLARIFLPLLKRRRFRGIKGGRGSGKSHFVGEDITQDCLTRHVRAVCGREIQNSIRDSSKQLIEDKINLLAHHYSGALFDAADPSKVVKLGDQKLFKRFMSNWRITEREISYGPTESLIIFKGLQNHTAASIKSLEGFTDLWLEEAQTITQRSLDLAIPTFRTGSQITLTWNPVSAKDPVEKLFKDNGIKAHTHNFVAPVTDPDFCLVEANYFDNPWFPDELRRDMERDKRRDHAKYAHVWLGKHAKRAEAAVFTNWQVVDFETPPEARFYFGADWGFSVDPSVLIRAWLGRIDNRVEEAGEIVSGEIYPDDINGDVLFIDYEAYSRQCEIDNTPALFAGDDHQKPARWQNPNKFKGIPEALKWPITADSARPETISYMKRRGFRIKPAVKGVGSVEDGLEFMQNFDIMIHPRCVHTIDEMSSYAYKIDAKTDEVLPILEDKDNHVIDAARYALESTRRSKYNLSNV